MWVFTGLDPNENVKVPRLEAPVEQPSPAITTDTVYEPPPKRKRASHKEKKAPGTINDEVLLLNEFGGKRGTLV